MKFRRRQTDREEETKKKREAERRDVDEERVGRGLDRRKEGEVEETRERTRLERRGKGSGGARGFRRLALNGGEIRLIWLCNGRVLPQNQTLSRQNYNR